MKRVLPPIAVAEPLVLGLGGNCFSDDEDAARREEFEVELLRTGRVIRDEDSAQKKTEAAAHSVSASFSFSKLNKL